MCLIREERNVIEIVCEKIKEKEMYVFIDVFFKKKKWTIVQRSKNNQGTVAKWSLRQKK